MVSVVFMKGSSCKLGFALTPVEMGCMFTLEAHPMMKIRVVLEVLLNPFMEADVPPPSNFDRAIHQTRKILLGGLKVLAALAAGQNCVVALNFRSPNSIAR